MISLDTPRFNAPRFICFKFDGKQTNFNWVFGQTESHSEMREEVRKTYPLATYFIGGFYMFADANATNSIALRRIKEKIDMREATDQEKDKYASSYKTIWKSLTLFGISDSLGLAPEAFDTAIEQFKKEQPNIPIKVIEDFNDYHDSVVI